MSKSLQIGFVTAAALAAVWTANAPAAHAAQCQAITSLEVVHRTNGQDITSVVRVEPGAASDPDRTLRSFQRAADFFGPENITSSRPIAEVFCFPDEPPAGSPSRASGGPSPEDGEICVNETGVYGCAELDPDGRFEFDDGTICTPTNTGESVTFMCGDSGILVTRRGDVVVTINSENLRKEVLARTEALRRLVGDANLLGNFHFNIIIQPNQQAALVRNEAFADISEEVERAADLGQPLPDIQQLLADLPDPPQNVAFFQQLKKAQELRQQRLELLAQITSGAQLSPQQVNAFFEDFVGKSRLVDRLLVERTVSSLRQAADLVNETIEQLASTPPTSTIYEQVKALASNTSLRTRRGATATCVAKQLPMVCRH